MNPFRYGEVVTGSDFCNRPGLVSTLRKHIESGHKVVLVGARRTGKTSLVHETVRRIRGMRLIHVQLWAVKSIDDLAQRLVDGITSMQRKRQSFLDKVVRSLASLRPRVEIDPYSGQPAVTLDATERLTPRGLQGVLDLLEELAEDHTLTVLLDEFQDVYRLGESRELLGALRDRIQRQRALPYVFAGSIRHGMEQLSRDPKSPFFKSLHSLEVGGLERTAFRAYLDKRFEAGGRCLPESTYDHIFALAEDNPSDCQQLCAAIWDRTSPGDVVGNEHLSTALRHIFATERKGYEALVKRLTDNQMRCLVTLARIGGAEPQSRRFLEESRVKLPASAKRALDRLVELELVYGPDETYRFFDPFFRQWLLARHPR